MRSFAGMVGVLALLTAFVVGGLAAIGVLSDVATSTGVGGSEVEAEIPTGERTTVSVEASVEAASLSWTISEARRTGEIRSYTYPPTTLYGDFIIIAFSVENTSDAPITLTNEEMTLVDKESGTAGGPAASVNSEYVPPARDPLFTEEGLLRSLRPRSHPRPLGLQAGARGWRPESGRGKEGGLGALGVSGLAEAFYSSSP